MTAGTKLVVAYMLGRYHQRSQTFVDGEIKELRRLGHEVRVVAVRWGQDNRSADPHVVYLQSLRISRPQLVLEQVRWLLRHPIRYVRFAGRAWRMRSERWGSPSRKVPWLRLPAVARDLEAAGVQVVHAHFAWAGAAIASCMGALLDLPWSMTMHANDIFNDQRNLPVKLSTVETIVTVCDYNREWLERHFRPAAPIEVLTCGVQPPVVAATTDARADVVAAARLVEKKGIDLVVRAVAVLASEGVRPAVQIIGDGPLRDQLESLSEELGTTDLITFVGELDHGEVLARIASARVFCLPCRIAADGDRDAMPTVIIEAMMAGVPVVSTREVGIPEMVDETCGRLVEPEDVTALAAALREILRDPELGRRLGGVGALRARERYTVEGQVARLSRIFSEAAVGSS